MDIQAISWEQTIALRQSVLWPTKPRNRLKNDRLYY